MVAPSKTLLAFDLDGVLFSSEPFLGEAYQQAIEAVNRQRPGSFDRIPETSEILQHIGWPVPTIFANLFPNADRQALERLHEQTLDENCSRITDRRGILYESVAETLRSFDDQGYRLCIASNGRRRYIETVLETYSIAALFAPVVTADEVGDKVGVLRAQMKALQADLVIMIGDRASDAEAARAIGCPFIGCDYGHGHRNEIESAGPIVDHFADLKSVVAAVANGTTAR